MLIILVRFIKRLVLKKMYTSTKKAVTNLFEQLKFQMPEICQRGHLLNCKVQCIIFRLTYQVEVTCRPGIRWQNNGGVGTRFHSEIFSVVWFTFRKEWNPSSGWGCSRSNGANAHSCQVVRWWATCCMHWWREENVDKAKFFSTSFRTSYNWKLTK